jgi:hypothetical protein
VTKGRIALIAGQLLAAILFVFNYPILSQGVWSAWFTPLAMVLLIALNSFWFTRFVSWLIFAASFFSLLILLSAFTLRWRLEAGFNPSLFYRAIIMYAVFIYVSLGQLKILGGATSIWRKNEPN